MYSVHTCTLYTNYQYNMIINVVIEESGTQSFTVILELIIQSQIQYKTTTHICIYIYIYKS